MALSRLNEVQPVPIDPHYSPQFYAELWGLSPSTVTRWFQDQAGVPLLWRDAPSPQWKSRPSSIPYPPS